MIRVWIWISCRGLCLAGLAMEIAGLGEVVGDFGCAEGTTALGEHDTLRDSITIEWLNLLMHRDVLYEDCALWADPRALLLCKKEDVPSETRVIDGDRGTRKIRWDDVIIFLF